MLAQHNGHISNHRHIPSHTTHNVLLAIQMVLTFRVQLSVISAVVVSLGQEHVVRHSRGTRYVEMRCQ